MDRRPTRRRLLRTAGALGLTAFGAGCVGETSGKGSGGSETPATTATNTSTPTETPTPTPEPGPPENGAVVFVYDDGRITDYTKALPVHREFDVPATSGVVSGWIGRKYYMDAGQLKALAGAGWEIASHTVTHTPVAQYELVEPLSPGDTGVHATHHPLGYHDGTTVEITDGDQTIRRTIEGLARDDTGTRYIVLTEPVKSSFSAKKTVIRYPPDFVERSLSKSKHDLEALGFTVDSFLAPYDDFDDYSMRFVPTYYDQVANARPGKLINEAAGFDPYETRRDYFIEYTSADRVEKAIEEIAATGALGVFGAHTFEDVVTQEKIRKTIQSVKDHGIEVLTLRDACRRYTSNAAAGSQNTTASSQDTATSSQGN